MYIAYRLYYSPDVLYYTVRMVRMDICMFIALKAHRVRSRVGATAVPERVLLYPQ